MIYATLATDCIAKGLPFNGTTFMKRAVLSNPIQACKDKHPPDTSMDS